MAKELAEGTEIIRFFSMVQESLTAQYTFWGNAEPVYALGSNT